MTRLVNPVPLFLDGRGALLDAGYVYIGESGQNPETPVNQLDVFWDSDLTIPASQPLRTLGGAIVNGMNLGFVYFEEDDFSITIRDVDSNLVAFIPTAFDLEGSSYQPLDSDLSAIAALATTAFGRGVLTLADAAALRTLGGLGSSAILDEATAAQYRANTADKVLTTDQAWGAAGYVALTPGANVAVDMSQGINFSLAMGGNYTLENPTNPKAGQSGTIVFSQDGTGSRTLAYAANWKFAGGTDPVLTTTANAKDVLFYQVLSATEILGSLVKAIA